MSQSIPRRSGIRAAAVAVFASAAVVGSLAVAAAFAQNRIRSSEQQLTPELDWVPPALELALLCTVPVLVAVLVLRRRQLSNASFRRKLGVFVGLPGALVVAVGGLSVLTFHLSFALFEPAYLGVKTQHPDGSKTAYLYSTGLFCGYEIFERPSGHLLLSKVDQLFVACDKRPARPGLRWVDGRMSVVDEQGDAVEAGEPFLMRW